MDISRWLSNWLMRHPLKEPSAMGPDYTREVISKLTLQAQPARRPAPRWGWSPAYALVSAAAVVLIVMALAQPQPARLAESTEDATWIQQTMQLLDELEQSEDATSGESTQSDEEWLQELEMIDEADLATSS